MPLTAPPVVPNAGAPPTPTVNLDSEALLKWAGVGLVVLAVGFAVSTAITRGWIGPELQLAGAMVLALGLIAVGLRLRPDRPLWTNALCVGGMLALFTTLASNLFLDQAPDSVALAATAVSGSGGLALGWAIRSEWTGTASLIGAAVGWLVIADGEPPFIVSAAWFAVLVAATIAVALSRQMPAQRFAAHGTGILLALTLADEVTSRPQQIVTIAIAAALFGSLARVPSVGDLQSTWQQLELQMTIATGPWAFGVIALAFEIDGDGPAGTTAILVGCGTVAAALAARRRICDAHFVSLVIGAGIAMVIGLALLLSTGVTVVALAVEAVGLVVLSRRFDNERRLLVNAGVLVSVAAVYVLTNMIDAWADDAQVGDDIVHLAIIVSIVAAAWLTGIRPVRKIAAVAALTLVLVWLGSVLVHLPQGQAVVSVSWAVIGVGVLIAGAMRKIPEVGAAGLAVIGLTVAKLLTVDLQEVDTLWRAGLFLVVGLGIMRIGFLLPRFTNDEDR